MLKSNYSKVHNVLMNTDHGIELRTQDGEVQPAQPAQFQ